MCKWHLVASQLERSDNGDGVTRDLSKWSTFSHVHFLFEERGREETFDLCQTLHWHHFLPANITKTKL